jgi:hypothetical protein
MKQLLNLYDRLKPEVITLLEKEGESYPHSTERITNALKNNHFLFDLPLKDIATLVGVNGVADIMETRDSYSDRYLLMNLNKLLNTSDVFAEVEE